MLCGDVLDYEFSKKRKGATFVAYDRWVLGRENRRRRTRKNLRWEVPQRPESGSPLMSAELAIFASVATWQSLNATSKCCPCPVRARANSAAMILLLAYNPVVRSVTATPTFTGGPSLEPVMCIKPISASTMTS